MRCRGDVETGNLYNYSYLVCRNELIWSPRIRQGFSISWKGTAKCEQNTSDKPFSNYLSVSDRFIMTLSKRKPPSIEPHFRNAWHKYSLLSCSSLLFFSNDGATVYAVTHSSTMTRQPRCDRFLSNYLRRRRRYLLSFRDWGSSIEGRRWSRLYTPDWVPLISSGTNCIFTSFLYEYTRPFFKIGSPAFSEGTLVHHRPGTTVNSGYASSPLFRVNKIIATWTDSYDDVVYLGHGQHNWLTHPQTILNTLSSILRAATVGK